jgi:O-antigen ligase
MVIWLFAEANSMTSLACFILTGGALIIASRVRARRGFTALHLVVAVVIMIPLFALFINPEGGYVSILGRNSTLTGRTTVWKVVLSMVHRPLFGAGFESFWLGDRLQRVWDVVGDKSIQEAHNGYIELYLNLGIFGLVFLAGVILAGYRNVSRMMRRNQQVGRIMIAFFLVGVIYNLTEAGFRMMSPVWIAFLLCVTAIPKDASQPGGVEIIEATYAAPTMQPRPVGVAVERSFMKVKPRTVI